MRQEYPPAKFEDLSIDYTNLIIRHWGRYLYLDNRNEKFNIIGETPFERNLSKPENKLQEFSETAFILTSKANVIIENFLEKVLPKDRVPKKESYFMKSWKYSVHKQYMRNEFDLFQQELAKNINEKGQDNALSLFPVNHDKHALLKLIVSSGQMFKGRYNINLLHSMHEMGQRQSSMGRQFLK